MRQHAQTKLGFFPLPIAEAKRLTSQLPDCGPTGNYPIRGHKGVYRDQRTNKMPVRILKKGSC